MLQAFIYLAVCSARNLVTVRIRRLREPRYLVGLVLGLVYVWWFLFPPRARRSNRPRGEALTVIAQFRPALEVVGAAALFLFGALAWILPRSGRPALTFTRAEVQFLFAAPLSRRQLIHYKLLRSQIGALVGSMFVTLIMRAGQLGQAWMVFVGMWVVMVAINLHLTGVSLRHESLAERGASPGRRWGPLVIILGTLAIVLATVIADWPRLASLESPSAIVGELTRLASTGAAHVVLYPFIALVRLPLSETAGEFVRALPIPAAILIANYVWVLRTDVSFEERSADYAERLAAAMTASPTASTAARLRAQPFVLAPRGRIELAFLWKNLIRVGRYASARTLLRVAPLAVVAGLAMSQGAHAVAESLARVSAVLAAATVLFGPQMLRNDLRDDLPHLATFRAWPVSGALVLRGEVLAPAMLLSAIAWVLVVAAASLSSSLTFNTPMSVLTRWSYAGGALLLAPGILLAQLVMQNGVAALFPAWAEVMTSRARGVDVMGQRLFFTAALWVGTAIMLLPATIVAATVGWGIHALTGLVPILIPAGVATATLVIESALLIEALGAALDRADVTTIARPE